MISGSFLGEAHGLSWSSTGFLGLRGQLELCNRSIWFYNQSSLMRMHH
jgi:hypothetical protein